MAFSTCGHEVAPDARFCPSCGTTVAERVTPTAGQPTGWTPPPGATSAAGTPNGAVPSPPPYPGAPTGPGGRPGEGWHGPPPATHALAGLPDYYRGPFARIDGNGGSFTATWNWAAFLLGPIWYLCRGLWVKALLLVFIVLATAGTLAIPAWIYAGIAGNYDLYLLRQRNKQLW
jgi:hypothetical protein